MRNLLVLVVVLGLCGFTAAARADTKADAKAVLDEAIKAMGGADKLAKLPATTFKSKGTLLLNGSTKYDYTDEWELQAPDKFRWSLTLQINDRALPITFGFTDKGSWLQGGNGNGRDLANDDSHMYRVDCRTVLLAHWLPALQEKGVELAPLGELKIDDRLCVGLKVSRKGWPDADLFFDKESHLPVKMETRFKETKDGPDVAHIFRFADYKESDGVKYFSRLKVYRDDTQLVDMEVTELKRLDKIDDSHFAKP